MPLPKKARVPPARVNARRAGQAVALAGGIRALNKYPLVELSNWKVPPVATVMAAVPMVADPAKDRVPPLIVSAPVTTSPLNTLLPLARISVPPAPNGLLAPTPEPATIGVPERVNAKAAPAKVPLMVMGVELPSSRGRGQPASGDVAVERQAVAGEGRHGASHAGVDVDDVVQRQAQRRRRVEAVTMPPPPLNMSVGADV